MNNTDFEDIIDGIILMELEKLYGIIGYNLFVEMMKMRLTK